MGVALCYCPDSKASTVNYSAIARLLDGVVTYHNHLFGMIIAQFPIRDK